MLNDEWAMSKLEGIGRSYQCIGHFYILHCLFCIRYSPDSSVTELAEWQYLGTVFEAFQ